MTRYNPEMLTTGEVYDLCGYRREKLIKLSEKGAIPNVRIGSMTLFPKGSLLLWMKQYDQDRFRKVILKGDWRTQE